MQLIFNIAQSDLLTGEEKEILQKAYASQLTRDGALIIAVEESRSQLKNKEIAFRKLDRMLARAFRPVKKRKKTTPTKASKKKRLKSKKIRAEKKQLRGRVDF